MTLKQLSEYSGADPPTRAEIERYIYGISDPQTRDMFYLHFIAGYSYSETALRLGGNMTRYCVVNRIRRFQKHRQKQNEKLATVK